MANDAIVLDGREDEAHGVDYLSKLHGGGRWVQTSYNTRAGEHLLGGNPLRKNYAGIGYHYDEGRNAFVPPQPYNSWKLDEEKCQWSPPIERPEGAYKWDEDTLNWVEHE